MFVLFMSKSNRMIILKKKVMVEKMYCLVNGKMCKLYFGKDNF